MQKETVGTELLLPSVNVTATCTSLGSLQLGTGLAVFHKMNE